ncbi:membrane lipoprotein lipid attachment site-containing protein [Vibrio sp. VB16]|uniref:membrane lipoprotein lipid attachment site-containing protein n=1 Tax=Vibrio sp. VB16 TaxID=2785746 RepID=UPI00189D57CC|nr:membrane lipoprotein lipid attachment site-containing protein [Vibrio sp. VB16]UGA53632.1 membrane lipoprotein lipid attachment site-containing protein [Vibrio sp. VB16]
MKKIIFLTFAVLSLSACSGVRQTDQAFDSHAESVNFLFLQFPGGDTQERAMELVPENAEVVTVQSTPSDTTSVLGVLNRLIGIDQTKVSGTVDTAE